LESTAPKANRLMISGRELFLCDGFVDPAFVTKIAAIVKTLHYQRKEKSRPDLPALAASADIADAALRVDPFFLRLRQVAEQMFPDEVLRDQRAYVNSSVFGDMYYAHRDCSAHRNHVTILYYVNLNWQTDWGGETIFYDDNNEAQLVVTPRAGRMVISRGAILHRGTVPTRACHEERYTIAYKMLSGDPANDPPRPG
jgi:Rps23 Pro-64 3,4-dihydroxylase Tpa1-like proline 4-hydroxylase